MIYTFYNEHVLLLSTSDMQAILDTVESSSSSDEDSTEVDDGHQVFSSEAQIAQTRIPTWKALLFRVSDRMSVDGLSIVPDSAAAPAAQCL